MTFNVKQKATIKVVNDIESFTYYNKWISYE